MDRSFIFFINPISGTKDKQSLMYLIKETMLLHNLPYQILETEKDGTYSYLAEKIAAEKISDIIICGGDGTVNQVVASILKMKVNIGIIPMGSGNGLALAAGISRNAPTALNTIINGKAKLVDAFNINDRFSCMLCGIGFDAQVAHDFARRKKRGLSSYVSQTITNLFSAVTYPFEITLANANIKTDAFFISIANSNQFGNHVTIAPKASLSDGLLDIVIVNKMNKLNMIFSLLSQIRGGKIQEPDGASYKSRNVQYMQAKRVCIENPSLAPLHIDGEPAETSHRFNVSVIENAFMLLQPTP